MSQDNWELYVPQPLRKKEKKMSWQDWKAQVDGPLEKLRGGDRNTAMQRYLRYARQWCAFGATFYKAKQITKPYNVILAVHWTGFFVFVPGERIPTYSYKFPDILSWSPSKQAITFRIGNMTNSFEMKFFTPQVRL
tara:strand:- start:804 stop:1211 length:408 start_codon:yes stop_codon:yes gene_type:complete